ncbi:MAG TPA: 3-deoxy-8-phosphooctulonate synthase [Elusimicrobiales bacterium]|nr:3-deoxy-8-phosphooctulonate synthase [Elusimicrobiales bacterium]
MTQSKKTVKIKNISLANDSPINFIVGPCVIESEKSYHSIAVKLKNIFKALNKNFILKASFDKANRTSIRSFRGIGLVRGIKLLKEIKDELKVPLIADVHEPFQAEIVAQYVDILQVPALLCRQTDLILACAKTKKPVNIKKGQFMAPWDMANIIEKIEATGNKQIMLTERGTTFGYSNLVVDMRSIEIMKEAGYPVIFDCTHSVQKPAAKGTCSGGDIKFSLPLAKAATAIKIAGLYLETHPDPQKALCDGANSIELSQVSKLAGIITKLDNLSKKI